MAGRIQWQMVSETIDRRFDEVYEYVRNPANFAEWATSFCRAVAERDGDWLIETDDGPMKLRFAEANPYGIVDHYVESGAGPTRLNPARVVPNGDGSRVIFTVFAAENEEDRPYAMDMRDAARDLRTLKHVLERNGASASAGRSE